MRLPEFVYQLKVYNRGGLLIREAFYYSKESAESAASQWREQGDGRTVGVQARPLDDLELASLEFTRGDLRQ